MLPSLINLLKCPVTGSSLKLEAIKWEKKGFEEGDKDVVMEGLLHAEYPWIYPIIRGVPRLLVESFLEHQDFLDLHVNDYQERRASMVASSKNLVRTCQKRNARTKNSFSQEWELFSYEEDKTWNMEQTGLLDRFLQETAENAESLRGKMILDVGCGNGLLNQYIAKAGATIIGMDLSLSIERAAERNRYGNAFFIQADMQYPPLNFRSFDIVHASGSLHHTNNTELSFSCIEPFVKPRGKMSVWLYQPNPSAMHNLINSIRNLTSKLPFKMQMLIYRFLLFPTVYIIKRIKNNKQNKREMMIDLLDWFSPEFRWEHTPDEVQSWFLKRNFSNMQVTTLDRWGFNMTGNRTE